MIFKSNSNINSVEKWRNGNKNITQCFNIVYSIFCSYILRMFCTIPKKTRSCWYMCRLEDGEIIFFPNKKPKKLRLNLVDTYYMENSPATKKFCVHAIVIMYVHCSMFIIKSFASESMITCLIPMNCISKYMLWSQLFNLVHSNILYYCAVLAIKVGNKCLNVAPMRVQQIFLEMELNFQNRFTHGPILT